jgi:hypothetical protein
MNILSCCSRYSAGPESGILIVLSDKDNVGRKVLLGFPNLQEKIIPIIDVRLANLILPDEQQNNLDG